MGVKATKGILRRRRTLLILFTLLGMSSVWPAASPCRAETLVYPMQYRTAAEAVPMVQSLLSPGGRAVADARTNSLLVVDDVETIQRVREFLQGFDKLGKQAKIRVRFDESASRERTSVEGRARASGEDWTVSAGKPMRKDGVEVRMQDRSRTQQGSSEFFLMVVSGSAGYIMVGQDILYTQRWVDLTRRYARVTESLAVQRIETGFEVMPVVLKDHADVEVIPRISHGGPGFRVVRFTEASTRLMAPIGQWVTIGGASQQSNEVIRAVLEAGRGERSSVTSISLLVEAAN
jgi:type II secretory pathway component GspD/PulD (secretin)